MHTNMDPLHRHFKKRLSTLLSVLPHWQVSAFELAEAIHEAEACRPEVRSLGASGTKHKDFGASQSAGFLPDLHRCGNSAFDSLDVAAKEQLRDNNGAQQARIGLIGQDRSALELHPFTNFKVFQGSMYILPRICMLLRPLLNVRVHP